MPDDDLQPPQAAHTHENTKERSKYQTPEQKNNHVGWTHSVQQVDFLLQLPDEVVFVLVGLQQPHVLLTLSGQLLKNTI